MITILQRPQGNNFHTPAFNNQFIVGLSDQITQPNFKYRVIVSDLTGGGLIATIDIPPDPTGRLRFDASQYSRTNVKNHFVPNQTLFQRCEGGARLISISFGEIYGTTPTYYPNGTFGYIVWNANLTLKEMIGYTSDTYLYSVSSVPNILTGFDKTQFEDTYRGTSQYIYSLVPDGLQELLTIDVTAFDSSGNVLFSTTISNTVFSGTVEDNYTCIDVGTKALDAINPAIIPPNTDYYVITDITDPNNFVFLKRYNIKCASYPVYSLHYLNKRGGFDTLHCGLISESKTTRNITSYKKTILNYSPSSISYNPMLESETTLSLNHTNSIKLVTDYLPNDYIEVYRELFTSPVVYLQSGSDFQAVSVNTDNYSRRNDYGSKQLTIEATYKHTNG